MAELEYRTLIVISMLCCYYDVSLSYKKTHTMKRVYILRKKLCEWESHAETLLLCSTSLSIISSASACPSLHSSVSLDIASTNFLFSLEKNIRRKVSCEKNLKISAKFRSVVGQILMIDTRT